ncbi:MAG TPA: PDZ domain-containing protein, partial [Bacteroidales bacterium]|nr:PDZ domain-containing protein [Bacteroidales bacterium]
MKIYKIGFKKINKIVIISVIVITSILSINFVNDDFEIAKNLDIYASLYRELNTYYVDELKPGELIKTSIESMLESLDPYTSFISESDLEDYKLMTTGQYGGIGALIHRNGDSIVISDPYEGFPAQINDIRSGDVILEVNG